MRTVYKYPLVITDLQHVEMPSDARPLLLAVQNRQLCLWVECDTDAPKSVMEVYVVGTGHDIGHLPDNARHLGSVVIYAASLVWHVYAA